MELVDLNMVSKVLSDEEFTIDEYIENVTNSKNDIEIQVDHIEKEIKNYKFSRILFLVMAAVFGVLLILQTCLIFSVSINLIFFEILVILLCIIISNMSGIILNKLYLIEMSNQILEIYYKKYESYEDRDIRSILAKY